MSSKGCNCVQGRGGRTSNGSYILLNDDNGGWWIASEAQIEAYKIVSSSIGGVQFLAGHVERGMANGYLYKANQYGIWLRTRDGVYRQIREISPARRPPK